MSKAEKNKKRGRSENSFGPEMDEMLRVLAKEAAGKPLGETLKRQSGSMLSRLIGRVVELAMEEELTEHLGYERHERIEGEDEEGQEQEGLEEPRRRDNTRNGYSSKRLKTSHGEASIQVPRDRSASFKPKILPARKTMSEELEQRVVALYTQGTSTRDIEEQLSELYGVEASAMMVSRLTARLEEELIGWRARPVEAFCAVLFVDAIFVKVRQPQGVVASAVYQVCAYTEAGKLEILGLYMPPEGQSAESASFWHQVFIELEKRGLKDVLFLCADGLSGLEDAARVLWPLVQFQPCVVHMVRNSTKFVAWQDRASLCADLRRIYQAPSLEAAELALQQSSRRWANQYPAIFEQWRSYLPRLEALFRFSAHLRKLIYTTNAIENIHNQQRKGLNNRRSMPNRASALRLMTLMARKLSDKNLAKKPRGDWRRIVEELHLLFPNRLPTRWGLDHL